MKVTVYHNNARGSFGGYEADDADLVKVHEVEVPMDVRPGGALAALEVLYERYNIGECDDALAYRGIRIVDEVVEDDGSGKAIHHEGGIYGIRSLSVGDVMVVGEVAYAVASFGFDPIALPATIKEN